MRPEAFLLPVVGLFLGSAYFAYRALAEAWGEALPRLVGAVDLALLSAALGLAKD